ncbi:gamma-aminobutyric acid receptor subunit alpha-6-like isoform X2 [Symsagittifera roscoffensis]|uniref:gamma-aminobutyric acid receptor subunit alpha-6-like isoform X2 n=1 Tax=Symsagittifera roscoffensis TaxID=84072 RepID=UPI00307B6788
MTEKQIMKQKHSVKMKFVPIYLIWIVICRANNNLERENSQNTIGNKYSGPNQHGAMRRHQEEVSRTLDRLFFKYDSRLRPNYGGPPVLINVTVLLGNLGPISEVEMNFRLDMALRQKWNDPRLKFSPPEGARSDELSLNYEFASKIWLPDIFFPESIQSFKHDVMQPNTLVRLYPNGDLLMSTRVTVISKCPMDLSFFPMDLQTCSLLIESYGYTTEDLVLLWSHGRTLESSAYFEIAQFDLLNITLDTLQLEFSTGKFSDLRMDFVLRRKLTYFILQLYLPSAMVVMLSWVSFWIPRDSVPARAALAITTVLTMITLIGTTNSHLPRVSNVKALDVHFALCLLFVFGALVEFAVVSYFNKIRFRNQGCPAERQFHANNPNHKGHAKARYSAVFFSNGHASISDNNLNKIESKPKAFNPTHVIWTTPPRNAPHLRGEQLGPVVDIGLIDVYCRALFPAAYLLVTLVYWIGYTNALYEKFRWTKGAAAAQSAFQT